MRIQYAEEEDFQGQAALWSANVDRSLKGRKGQAALRRLEVALLALPEKRLIADAIRDDDGNVCALGALAQHEDYQGSYELPGPPTSTDGSRDDPEAWDDWELEGDEQIEEAMLNLAAELKVPKLVAMAIIDRNDDPWRDNTPEERYNRVLSWVQKHVATGSVTMV